MELNLTVHKVLENLTTVLCCSVLLAVEWL